MMLQALIAYAERENLGDANFEPVKVTWQIEVSTSGKFSGSVIDLRAVSVNQKTPMKLIRPFTRGDDVAHGRSHFLCDSLERALLYLPKADPGKEASRKLQFDFFKNLLLEAADHCPNEKSKLNALTQFFSDESELARARVALSDAKAKSTENAVFAVSSERILGQPEIGEFWKNKRATIKPAVQKSKRRATPASDQTLCLATGLPTKPVRTTRKIKGLWAGQGSGTNLIAFDKASFASFGLKKAFNAALSPEADVKVAAALEQLIQRGVILDPYGDRKKPQPVFLHWTKKPAIGTDLVELLASANEADVKNLLTSPKLGMPAAEIAEDAFYLVSLSANSTRIVVRDWLESSVQDVAVRVGSWFQDIGIIGPNGLSTENAFKLARLVASVVPKKRERGFEKPDYDKAPPQLTAQLVYAALRGTPLPMTALAAALRRQHIETRKPEDKFDPKLNPARIALIKACLIRSPNRKEHHTMTEKLDPQSKDSAYLCGQLFAVVGRLQLLALGKIGASIAERTYGGVATRPSSTFGPLFTKLPAYMKKANTRFPGSGTNKQKELESLSVRIESLGGLPRTLDLEGQGRFALGYYCQLAQYRTDRAEADAAEQAEQLPDDPI